ncbi:type I restriction endonuclease subunit S [Pseudomonas aeruginosa]|uniref:restriction endonuclease subunit S n=1 Tax=Pseudomonas aeruginosa TaxID=287 RepID=UPI0012DD3F7E|nr:restriction endonuclease subunit S [Pseudomonas aeruginosa]MCO3584020.1 type I restriction endonuclease subunit S [Pseudomonas aeruginosa]MCO3724040.1 type I restriction endonuclease subunit S [Pseudomonas aeruginosa]HBO5033480.1 restriction endonuclease subunit S [Pseudomonas aeruginosa]HCE6500178.1 restriction endonuclease subunit S [Pseudomonas aeruginosa]HCE9509948.1 restriction endonuclease subunit S [Pseudomonas aeruginosa]
MDAQQFLAEFEHIANAPGGVARLRQLVFSLASEGKLLADCEQLESTQLDKVADFVMGQAPPGNECNTTGNGTVFVKTGEFGELYPVVREWTTKPLKMAKQGDVLICVVGATVGKLNLAIDCAIGRSVAAIRPRAGLATKYLYFMLMPFTLRLRSDSRGSAQGVIGKAELSAVKLRVPSDEEQSRIVAKVDELMALCDKLEAQQQARRTLQNTLRQSTLQAVASSQSPHELQTSWTRLADNFGRLFHAPEDVADLRKMASELAIRGALDVFSEPTDTSTVDVYLAELARKKSGKRFAKSVQVDEDIPLPNGWRWVLLEDLLSDSDSGWSPKCEAQPRRDGEWGVLKVSAVTWGAFNPDENKRLPLSLEAKPECEVKPGDFMLSRANTAELVARSVIAPDDCPKKLLMSDKIVRLIFLDDALKPWVNLVNNSDFARTYYKERATGTSDSMRNVSRQVIHELPIPLPSLKVQERVLLALSRLLQYCDSLEQQAAYRIRLSAQLSASAIATLTGIAIEQEEEPMKAPQTELIAPLRLGAAPDIKVQAPLATILARHHGEMSAKDLWQRFGGEIDAFYAQLKTEVAHGWILEPVVLRVRSDLEESFIPNELKPKALLFKLLKKSGGSMYEKELRESFAEANTSFEAQLKIEMDYAWITRSSAAVIRPISAESEDV